VWKDFLHEGPEVCFVLEAKLLYEQELPWELPWTIALGQSEGATERREGKCGDITGWGGGGGGGTGSYQFRLFWAPNGTLLTARSHFTGHKKVWFPGPNLLLDLVMDLHASKT
jgi:hypothetical protein